MQVPAAILAIIEKYLNGTAGPEEKKQLYDWYHAADREDPVFVTGNSDTETAIEQRLRQRLHATLEKLDAETVQAMETIRVENSRSPKRFVWPRVAAAVFVLLAAGSYFFFSHHQNRKIAGAKTSPEIKSRIEPGGNKAVLTLANGSKIVLDSNRNGLLAEQGDVRIIKTKDGQITYDVSQPTAASQSPVYNIMTTPRGGQYRLVLPDGSQVWLNAASSIRYPISFSGTERRVEVAGEAYFEIATLYSGKGKDKLPFIVQISKGSGPGAEIEVLGTHFNVNAYDDDPATAITLLKGSIRMKKGGATAILTPGQRATVSEDRELIDVVNDPDAASAIAWKEGRFEFNGNLKGIMRRIARWYDLEVVYEQNVTNKVFGGAIPRQSDGKDVLKMLELTGSIHFKIEGRKVTVMK